MPAWLVAAAVAVISVVATVLKGTTYYVPGACPSVQATLKQAVFGQDLALTLLTDSICSHITNPEPSKLLVMSVHGPPGVGKTFSHHLLAKSLYHKNPAGAVHCPGRDCSGYMVRLS
jgi:ATP-dependent Clp protease ATP-binding subunit ClpA